MQNITLLKNSILQGFNFLFAAIGFGTSALAGMWFLGRYAVFRRDWGDDTVVFLIITFSIIFLILLYILLVKVFSDNNHGSVLGFFLSLLSFISVCFVASFFYGQVFSMIFSSFSSIKEYLSVGIVVIGTALLIVYLRVFSKKDFPAQIFFEVFFANCIFIGKFISILLALNFIRNLAPGFKLVNPLVFSVIFYTFYFLIGVSYWRAQWHGFRFIQENQIGKFLSRVI